MSNEKSVIPSIVTTIVTIIVFALLEFTTGFFTKFIAWLGFDGNNLLGFVMIIVLFCFTIAAIAAVMVISFYVFKALTLTNTDNRITKNAKLLIEEGKNEEAILLFKEQINKNIWLGRSEFQNTLGKLISILQECGFDDSYLKDFKHRIIWFVEDQYEKKESYDGQKDRTEKIEELYATVEEDLGKEFEALLAKLNS